MSTPTPDGSGIDGTPAWAYDEDHYCVCCGNGRWKYHMPECELRDALDIAKTLPAGEWRVSVGVDGTRTVTPLRPLYPHDLTCDTWVDVPENGDPTT